VGISENQRQINSIALGAKEAKEAKDAEVI
jgi:hypothetical protein